MHIHSCTCASADTTMHMRPCTYAHACAPMPRLIRALWQAHLHRGSQAHPASCCVRHRPWPAAAHVHTLMGFPHARGCARGGARVHHNAHGGQVAAARRKDGRGEAHKQDRGARCQEQRGDEGAARPPRSDGRADNPSEERARHGDGASAEGSRVCDRSHAQAMEGAIPLPGLPEMEGRAAGRPGAFAHGSWLLVPLTDGEGNAPVARYQRVREVYRERCEGALYEDSG
mmetsp:Transcript_39581/g.79110  ORF Transcript_39581/g.79110 Transcript_39581/m.79110 type:complete len:229 (-) Transcript_39581:777-1463(-)